MDDFRKAHPGDRLQIPARAYNAFVDAAVAHQRRQRDLAADELRERRHHGIIPVRNGSDDDLSRFHALALTEPLFLPGQDGMEKTFRNRLAMKGVKPTDDSVPGQFAVATEPIRKSGVGLCVVHGVTPARVLVRDEDHTFADIAADETVLVSNDASGALILWKSSGTGEKWAVIEIGRKAGNRLVAILGQAEPISGYRFRWRYPWQEARIDGNPGSNTYGAYVPVPGGLSSRSASGQEDRSKWAYNRFESHLATMHPEEPPGTDGFGGMKSLFIPGDLEPNDNEVYCPEHAAVPLPQPVMKGVAVELTAERDTRGKTVWAFEALNGVVLTEFNVPQELYR